MLNPTVPSDYLGDISCWRSFLDDWLCLIEHCRCLTRRRNGPSEAVLCAVPRSAELQHVPPPSVLRAPGYAGQGGHSVSWQKEVVSMR